MLTGALIGALAVLVVVEAWLVWILRAAGVWARPIGVPALSEVEATRAMPNAALHRRVTQALGGSEEEGLALCLAALRWLVDLFPADANPAGGDAKVGRCSDPEIFAPERRPHCGEIAALYRAALAALGIDSRTIVLRKNIFDPHDSHISVEARVDGRWVLIDPTFHATFADREGGLLGAQQVKALAFKGQRDAIAPTVHGPALCPLALGDYYVDVLACFNNVFVRADPPRPALFKLPPVCYALGPKLAYEKLADESVTHLRFWRQIYFAAAFVVPCIALAVAAALLVAVVGCCGGQ
ncbi:MAG: transglutaminase domain-containing protein [Planctomycetota bacterium]